MGVKTKKKDDPFKDIISTKEASILWGLHQDSIKRLAREGKIIAKKLGNERTHLI